MTRLEDRLGVKRMQRTTPRPVLTGKGETLLTPGRGILAAIDEPITLKFYVSERVQSIPQLSTYGTRVQELLQQYQQLAQGQYPYL